jgi:hypothetical protein
MTRHVLVAGLLVLTGACSASNSNNPSKQTGPTVTAFTLSPQSVVLSAVGQTARLTATATFTDGSTQDVTSMTTWTSDAASVVSVSNTGLLMANGLGAANITAKFTPANGSAVPQTISVVVTPPGTFVAIGQVWDSNQSGDSLLNVIGVSIVAQPSGLSTTSTPSAGVNNFALGGLTDGVLTFAKSGYETTFADTITVSLDKMRPVKLLSVPMQPVTRIAAGASVSPSGSGATFLQSDGSVCLNCYLVRVTVPSAGTLHLELSWAVQRNVPLSMSVNGVHYAGVGSGSSSVTADVAVGAGEVLVYIGPDPFVLFTLGTSMK